MMTIYLPEEKIENRVSLQESAFNGRSVIKGLQRITLFTKYKRFRKDSFTGRKWDWQRNARGTWTGGSTTWYSTRENQFWFIHQTLSETATTGGLGDHWQGLVTSSQWSDKQQTLHKNVLDWILQKMAFTAFTRLHEVKSIYIQNRHHNSPNVFSQDEGKRTKSSEMNKITQEIWDYLITKWITIIVEHLPTGTGNAAVFKVGASGDWAPGIQRLALFLANQVEHVCISLDNASWKSDPYCSAMDAIWQECTHMFPYSFPPFGLIGKVFSDVFRGFLGIPLPAKQMPLERL